MNVNKLDWRWIWKLDDRHLMIPCLNPQIHQAIWCLEMDWRCFWDSKVAENRSKVEVIRRFKVWIYIGSKNRSKTSQTALASSPASNTPMRTLVRTLYSWFKAYSTFSEVVKKALIWDEHAEYLENAWKRWENAMASWSASNTLMGTLTGFSVFSLADSTKNNNIIMWGVLNNVQDASEDVGSLFFFFPAPFLLV